MYATRSRRVKTDRRDARTLAEACKLGAYRPAHRTSDGQHQVRVRSRSARLWCERAAVTSRSALAVAGLMGALGCTIAGTAGVAGMLAGVLAAGAPLLVTARR
jgi:hypothetical protein